MKDLKYFNQAIMLSKKLAYLLLDVINMTASMKDWDFVGAVEN